MSEEKLNENTSKEELIRLLSYKEYKIRLLENKLRKKETILEAITVMIVSVVTSVVTLIVMAMVF
ncbi:hypothetical protein [Carnobacterium maltaromaticum]|uniref:hypothetical protein n=1 Tax=Carnobacterium maltaromaticum TaxID=2751 RepID=UPI00026C8A85|nr:hypothetical protein [Carnobacterium maltaromaticum]